ncbi:acireductone synthase [Cyanobium sp. NIES-981]|uniref:acireductone synthase n=1 Tax=Cyanobium sp. NIES-981 TaxID=1851505 RepID=UPI0007DCE450|nr:acireductone synthase [Cyanobium sp. NIES-981]SBO43458.1 Enolase-phosphatase E1 [Cyanobium sp. NIES-981]
MTIPQSGPTVTCQGVSHLLLDIEGTTCPVSFVAEVLFPYAAAQLDSYLEQQGQNPPVLALLEAAREAWTRDADPAAQQLREQPNARVADYLALLIRQDRKLTALKELQGLIWEEGYAEGILQAPLFQDVPSALERWKRQGLTLAVYSSGSVQAQKLLYQHSTAGDLRPLFSHWFDTRNGAKHEPASYRGIAEVMEAAPAQILFISDALAECVAAQQAGLQVVFSLRPGNSARAAAAFPCVEDYTNLLILPGKR